ncbi:unnamed protein product, partial [Dovyalis caffra]
HFEGLYTEDGIWGSDTTRRSEAAVAVVIDNKAEFEAKLCFNYQKLEWGGLSKAIENEVGKVKFTKLAMDQIEEGNRP